MERAVLGVIGGGFMARAIVEGAISKRFLKPDEIAVSEPSEEKRNAFAKLGVRVMESNRELAENCQYLLLAVKPQVFPSVAEELNGIRLPVLISIMAGKSKRAISSLLGGLKKIARVMPNLPCSVGEGMSAIDAESLSNEEKEFVLELFQSVGKAVEMKEGQLDAVTGISGSGPAYVYLFLKSLIEAGKKEGLSEEQAQTLVMQTVRGGLKMAETSHSSLEELIAAVSSKGGTTVAALESFEKDNFDKSIERAVSAAVRRAEELSQ